jgi:hypothetical protein
MPCYSVPKPAPNTWNKDFIGYPIAANLVCYDGDSLPLTGIIPGDNLSTVLGKIDNALNPQTLTQTFLTVIGTNPVLNSQFCEIVNGCIFVPTTTTTTTIASDLFITETQTTDPTNEAGDNGTATITFTGTISPFTYTLDGNPQGNCTSPFVITGLSASTTYTVVITDDIGYTASTTFTLGESSFVFDADYIMVTYEFTNGQDLDTRTRIVTPDVGQDVQNDYLGWACQSIWPIGDPNPYFRWGGDNTGLGFESVLLDVNLFKAAYPSATQLVMDMRAFWFAVLGTNPVNVEATLWKGGAPTQTGCGGYCWTNPTATSTFVITSVGKVITDQGLPIKSLASGERVATLTYDLVTGAGVLNNNDTTTPSV